MSTGGDDYLPGRYNGYNYIYASTSAFRFPERHYAPEPPATRHCDYCKRVAALGATNCVGCGAPIRAKKFEPVVW